LKKGEGLPRRKKEHLSSKSVVGVKILAGDKKKKVAAFRHAQKCVGAKRKKQPRKGGLGGYSFRGMKHLKSFPRSRHIYGREGVPDRRD